MAKIKIVDLHKSYSIGDRKFEVLKGLNLEFNSGELIALYGESGSGKSTLMNVIGGLDTFDSGNIMFNEKSIAAFTATSMDYYRNKKVGFIFQEFNLLENLSIIDNVILPANMAGMDTKQAKKRAVELLKLVGLEKHIKKNASQLSGGQKQRVAIARALINDPDIILADEPTGALDSQTQDSIMELLKKISKDGKCIAVITHSEQVAQYASRVVTLVDGVIEEKVSENTEVYVENKESDSKNSNLGMMKAFKIAFKNLTSKKVRTTLVAIAISLGITGSLLISSLSSDVTQAFKETTAAYEYDPTTVTSMFIPIVNITNESEKEKYLTEAIDMLMDENSAIEGYDISIGISNTTYQDLVATPVTMGQEQPFYIDADYTKEEYATIKFGEYPTNEKEVYFTGQYTQLAYPPGLEDQFKKVFESDVFYETNFQEKNDAYYEFVELFEKEIIGQSIVIETEDGTEEFKIVGSKEFTEVSMNSGMGISNFLLPYEINKDYLETNMDSPNFYYKDIVFLNFDSEADKEAYLEGDNTMIEPKSYGQFLFINLDFSSFTDLFLTIFGVVENVFLVLIGVSLFVSVFMVAMIVYISTIERKKEIGTLRAIGAKRSNIRSIFISEGVFIGIYAYIISLVFSLLGIKLINIIMYSLNQAPDTNAFSINAIWAAGLFVVIITVMFIASLYPAVKASKQNPIDALREE